MERLVMAPGAEVRPAELSGSDPAKASRAEAINCDWSVRDRTCPVEYTRGLCAMGTSGSLGLTGTSFCGIPAGGLCARAGTKVTAAAIKTAIFFMEVPLLPPQRARPKAWEARRIAASIAPAAQSLPDENTAWRL
jgi:hypothetical protein